MPWYRTNMKPKKKKPILKVGRGEQRNFINQTLKKYWTLFLNRVMLLMLQTPNSIWFVFLWHGFFLSGRQIYIKEYDWSVINIYCCKGFDGRCSHTNSLGKASLYLSYKTKFCAYLSPPHSNNGTKHNCSPRKKSLVEYIEYLTKSWLFWWRQRRAPLLSNNSDSCNIHTPKLHHA